MSKMSNLALDIQEDLEAGRLSFAEIAAKHEVPISWVEVVNQEMLEQECQADPGDMDGDHASALASCGWGTDEDYIMENDYMDDY